MEWHNSKSSIIKSINSPLGFFALSLLTVEGFLGIVLVFSEVDNTTKFWGMIIGASMFVLVVVIVAVLVYFKPENLTFGEEGHLEKERLYGSKERNVTKKVLSKEPKTEQLVTKKN